MKASRKPVDVQRKTEGIKKKKKINLLGIVLGLFKLRLIFVSKKRLKAVITIESNRILKKSGTPNKFRTFAGKYAIHRKKVGAVSQPLPNLTSVFTGSV